MDPLSIGLGIVGLGMQLFGGLGASDAASKQAAISQQQAGISQQQSQLSAQSSGISGQIAGDEMQVNAQKQQQVQLEAGRMQLENFRNTQKARAQGLASATTQGAQFGSGLQGGQAEAQDTGGNNALNIGQNLDIANNVFGINQDIGNKKIAMTGLQSQIALLGGQSAMLGGQSAALGGQAATDQGIASLGGSVIKAGPIIGAFGKNFSVNTGFGGPYI